MLGAATIGLFHAKVATAQQPANANPWTLHQEWRSSIPKNWGKVVGYGTYPTAGAALVFEADDGSVRIVKISDGPPEVIGVPR